MECDSRNTASRGPIAGGGNTEQRKNRAGTVQSVQCGSKDQTWTMVVQSNGHPLTFHTNGFFAFGFSDTLWYGEDHFSTCRHIVGRRAIVRYLPTPNASYSGDVVEVDVRDDLFPADSVPGKTPVAAKR